MTIKKKVSIYKATSILCLTVICLIFCLFQYNRGKTSIELPPPTEVTYVNDSMESAKKSLNKKQWFEDIHKAAPGIDWRKIEEKNRIRNYKNYLSQLRLGNLKDNTVNIADGYLIGEWNEKGSNNLSGSVTSMDYDTINNILYAVSAGGVLWKSPPDGLNWTLVNDQLKFDTRFLKIVYPDSENIRIICSISGKPYYSDDGLEWTLSSGSQIIYGGSTKNFKKLKDGKYLFYLADEGAQRNIKLYFSKDYGKSFSSIFNFSTSDLRNISMDVVSSLEKLFLIEQIGTNKSRIFEWNKTNQVLDLVHPNSAHAFGSDGNGNIRSRLVNGTVNLFSFNGNNEYLKSNDMGNNWIKLSDLPANPWRDGIFVSYEDPQLMILSEVEAHVSRDGGLTWSKINTWPEYYDDPITKLHADMMFIDEFKIENNSFIAIANHGGINVSYDKAINNNSISLSGLNISQYYSVRTYPKDPNYIFAGSQDQGIQRGYDLNEGAINFTQLFSGDYGHICFANLGESMWTVYPGGWVFYFSDPTILNFPQESFQLESLDESVWLPPMISSPYKFNGVLLAGGQKDGGSGSHILELSITDFGFFNVTEWPFDFKISGGTVTGMAYNSLFTNVFYVITSNGRFYLSNDSGQTFNDLSHSLNGSHYLYGHDILSSKADYKVLYVAGSGYSNSPVYRSTDGGLSFQSIKYNLPSTTVFDLDMDPDGQFIFAATAAGPYVFIEELEEWFELGQSKAPNQTYWSVEFLQNQNKIRFGTYGRGIWDLDINYLSAITENDPEVETKIYPNPVSSVLHIESENEWKSIKIIDVSGNIIEKRQGPNNSDKIELNHYPVGIYYVIFESTKSIYSKKFIKI